LSAKADMSYIFYSCSRIILKPKASAAHYFYMPPAPLSG
jgi:hypothetical protein